MTRAEEIEAAAVALLRATEVDWYILAVAGGVSFPLCKDITEARLGLRAALCGPSLRAGNAALSVPGYVGADRVRVVVNGVEALSAPAAPKAPEPPPHDGEGAP